MIAANDLEYISITFVYEAQLEKRIDASRTNSVDELLSAINSTNRCLARTFGAEGYIPKCVRDNKDKACTALIR